MIINENNLSRELFPFAQQWWNRCVIQLFQLFSISAITYFPAFALLYNDTFFDGNYLLWFLMRRTYSTACVLGTWIPDPNIFLLKRKIWKRKSEIERPKERWQHTDSTRDVTLTSYSLLWHSKHLPNITRGFFETFYFFVIKSFR